MAEYSTIRIFPEGTGKKRRWKYSIERHRYDRVTQPVVPHPLGFLHYHGISDEEAFQKLKEFLVDKHKKELKSLQQSLERLEEMTFAHNSSEK